MRIRVKTFKIHQTVSLKNSQYENAQLIWNVRHKSYCVNKNAMNLR